MKRSTINAALALGLLAIAGSSVADTASYRGKVTRMLSSESDFGGCMIATDVNPKDSLPACKNTWVTLSCDGGHLPKDVSRRLLDQAQIAYALNKPVVIFIDDARRNNGYCLGYRIDLKD
jgi:hypothetical protein